MLQLYNFFIFIILGIIISFIFDIFRILRKKFKTSNFITYIEDILFWVISGFLIISAIFKFNDGELRAYLFIGIFLGIIIYIMLFTKLVNNIFLKILTPVKLLLDFILSLSKKIFVFITNCLKNCKNKSKINRIDYRRENILMKRIFRNKKILKVIIILIVLSYFIYVLIKQQTTLNSYQTEQDYVSSQIQDQQEYKNELADMEANINSDEYIEQIARDKLDMYLPNERVYVDANK